MKNRDKKNRGSITVEATLFLPVFLFAFLTIYNLVYYARAQVIIQYAADQAAKEVAQYSYLLDKLDLLTNVDRIHKEAENLDEDIKKLESNLGIIQDAASDAMDGNFSQDKLISAGEAAKDTYGQVKGYINSPEDFLRELLAYIKSGAIDNLSTFMIGKVAKACIYKQLVIASGNVDYQAYLKKLNITGPISTDHSQWCQNGSRNVKLIVDFQMTSNLPYFKMQPRHYRVCASTRIWSGV